MTHSTLRRGAPWAGSILIAALAPAAVVGQTAAAAPAFEAATIKPSEPITPSQMGSGRLHLGMTVEGTRVDIGNMSLTDLIRTAYRVKAYQVSGPDWMSGQRFDILAKAPEGSTKEQVPEMLQALLAERFKMALHRDSKEHPVYALVVAKNGPKLKDAAPDTAPEALPAAPGKGPVTVNQNGDGKGVTLGGGQMGTTRTAMSPDGTMHMEMKKMNLPMLADMLARFVDRPVLDKTGLKGNYEVSLNFSMADMMQAARASGVALGHSGDGDAGHGPASAASDPSGGSIFASVQQLGLKLEPRKAPLEMLVVDRVEKSPTDN